MGVKHYSVMRRSCFTQLLSILPPPFSSSFSCLTFLLTAAHMYSYTHTHTFTCTEPTTLSVGDLAGGGRGGVSKVF